MTDLISKCDWNFVDRILEIALKEDIGSGDITTSSLIRKNHVSNSVMIAKGGCILAGLPFAERIFNLVDSGIKFKSLKKEGSRARSGAVIAEIKGKTECLLMAERTALNLVQRLSGIATLTGRYAAEVKGTGAKIVDTRKTAPGLRLFEKYAVRAGGGGNHRFGLFDGILIKDNHITAVGGIRKAVGLARKGAHHLVKIEVEVKNLQEVKEAMSAGTDIIMLDNMTPHRIKKAVDLIRSRKPDILIEASGNVNLENVRKIAETGVDLISVGAVTHSAPAADISMRFKFS
jgi:nicotinate-nucleotide pyrophosphorylase (carboxylating)